MNSRNPEVKFSDRPAMLAACLPGYYEVVHRNLAGNDPSQEALLRMGPAQKNQYGVRQSLAKACFHFARKDRFRLNEFGSATTWALPKMGATPSSHPNFSGIFP